MQYAHAHRVIHRDLKPGNMLVSAEGRAMLLDFGIAMLLDDEGMATHETELRQLGGRALTLDYAAPEQLSGDAVSIATDVYALGTLLYALLAGLLLRRSGRLPDNAHAALNTIILHVSLPAVTLRHLRDFRFDSGGALWPVLMPWALFVIGAALFYIAGRLMRLPAASVGALTLVGGFGNTSFVGLPMIESLHGHDGLGLGLLIDQFGSYLALSTLGILATVLYAAGGRASPREMARRVITFPPFVALILALLLNPVPFPAVLDQMLARIGDTLAPLALLWFGDTGPGMVSRVTVIEATMPPMIGAAVVASQANLAPRLMSLTIGLGIPIRLSTAAMWHWLFGVLVA